MVKTIGLMVGIIATITGGAWAAKGYIDTEMQQHTHNAYVERNDLSEMNRKLDEIRDRLARIEGRLER